MTFPAWFDLNRDPAIRDKPSAQRVYAHLIENNPAIFFEPHDAKAWLIADTIGVEKETVIQSLSLLIARGYLLDHGRSQNNVRRVTVALVRKPGSTPNPPAPTS